VDRGIEALLAELQQGKSQRLQDYLDFSARFHRYSVHNQILIQLQCPHATFVAGYHKWKALGYQVARGEKAIRILAPRPYQHLNRDTGDQEEAVYFVAASVFDASQLANVKDKPLPTFFTPLADDQQAFYAQLVQVVQADGIAVTEEVLGREQGVSARGRIAIHSRLDSTNKVLTLLHEYVHELLHWNRIARAESLPVKECHAEAVSYVVAQHFGIHNPFSADYLQNWGTTSKELIAELDVVRRTAAYIIDRIETPSDDSPHEDVSLSKDAS
jgi:hypothetical protein